MATKWTEQQKEIVKAVGALRGSEFLQVDARAGTGKTTTAAAACVEAAEGGKSVFAGAFNTAAAKQLQLKFEDAQEEGCDIEAKTFHAAGLAAVNKSFGARVKVETQADSKAIQSLNLSGKVWSGTLKLMGLAKQELLSAMSDRADFERVADHYGVSLQYNEQDFEKILDNTPLGLALASRRAQQTKEIDFNDMLWLPWVLELEAARRYRLVVVDEAQDSNWARRDLAWKMSGDKGAVVIVGDEFQSIYGFSGATSNAMDVFSGDAEKRKLTVKRLPLTVCWRCPGAVILYAQEYVKDIEVRPSAPHGLVSMVKRDVMMGQVKPGDVVLGRLNAPLARIAMELLRQKRAVKIEGRDIGKGLLGIVKKFGQRNSLKDLLEALVVGRDGDVAAAMAKGQSEAKIQGIVDKYETLIVLIEGLMGEGETSPLALERLLTTLFDDTLPGYAGYVLLSTIHKAKGREWPRVWWNDWQWRSKWQQQPWEMQQERNLKYVAITRAMEELICVEEV